jgi:hypothetical protein
MIHRKTYFNYINKFIPFDISKIFKLGDPIIFGGAVRDSIAKLPIYDIDIVSLPETTIKIHNLLMENNYVKQECLDEEGCSQGIISKAKGLCKNCKSIYEFEWFKVVTYTPKMSKFHFMNNSNSGFVPIQLIKPSLGHFFLSNEGALVGFNNHRSDSREGNMIINTTELQDVKDFIIKEVDIACCGVIVKRKQYVLLKMLNFITLRELA